MEDIITTIIEELLDGETVFTTMRGYTFDDVHSVMALEDSEKLNKLYARCCKLNSVVDDCNLAQQIGILYRRAVSELAEKIAPDVEQKRKQDALLEKADFEATWRKM